MSALDADIFYYLRQVNGVNGGDTAFVRRVSVSMRSGPVNQTSLKQTTDRDTDYRRLGGVEVRASDL